ncbi:MAG TPA: iron uptake transporter permease EfeU [Candidatus Deferrimicrobiaceae bacterium]|nr:iron uptake transporter permease EfeU [Candidatus Deferrimicrobiaceae bacterium]
MDVGAVGAGFLIGLREGVEAALILAIVLAYLVRTGNGDRTGLVWLGAGLAVLISVAAGLAIFATVGALEAPYEQVFEGLAMLLAAAVVTWMLFWMRRQSAAIKGELEARLDRALSEGTLLGLALLAFTAVIREGIETALFLVGTATSTQASAASVLLGAVVGLATAAVLGWVIFSGSRRINLRAFFRWTGIGLIFIAAGLLSHAVHEFIEIGLIPFGTQTAFDISGLLPHEEGIGQFLRAIFGYTASPEWTTLIVHLGYLVVVLGLYLRPATPSLPPSRPVEPSRAQETATS